MIATQPRAGERPSILDARLHVSALILSIHVLGQVAFEFSVSIPQIAAAILSCALLEVAVVRVRRGALVWPASAILTGSGVALILRDVGTQPGDHWTTTRWWLFALVAAGSLATKYLLRVRTTQVFNPSNIGLVVVFLVLGENQVQPLDFWWGPFDQGMVLAYTIIIAGGLVITDRLRLVEMTVVFWAVLGLLLIPWAVMDHSMTAAWSVSPITGWHFWWVVMTSPETLIFAFFMVTDPRIVPPTRRARVGFGAATAISSGLLLAPQSTEYGAKVGLLAGLVVACVAHVAVRHRAFGTRSRRAMAGAAAVALLLIGTTTGRGDDVIEASGDVDPTTLVPPVDTGRLPAITVDPAISTFGGGLLGRDDARAVAEDLLLALDVEALAQRERRVDVLGSVDHGARLRDMTSRAESASDTVEVPSHSVDHLHLTVARVGGQGAARLAAEACGTVEWTTHGADGSVSGRRREQLASAFVLRRGVDERWLIVDELTSVEC